MHPGAPVEQRKALYTGKLHPQCRLYQKAKLFTESRHCKPEHAHRKIPPPSEAAHVRQLDSSGLLFLEQEALAWQVQMKDGTSRGSRQRAEMNQHWGPSTCVSLFSYCPAMCFQFMCETLYKHSMKQTQGQKRGTDSGRQGRG